MNFENNHYPYQSSEAGQALLEYMLVVVITVAILVGLASQLFSPLQKFLQAYMGSYVECLLETGELPGTLGGDYDTATTSDCRGKLKAAFAALDEGNGSGSKSTKGGGGSSGDSSSASDPNKDSDKSDSAAGGANGSSEARNGSSSQSGSGSGGSSSLLRRNGRKRSKSEGMKGGGDDKKVQSIPLNEFYSGNGGRGGVRIHTIRRGERHVIPMGSLSDEELKIIKQGSSETSSRITVQELGEPRVKKIPILMNDNSKKDKSSEEPETSLGIGGFLRYLLIAAIIVAILVFVGRQAFQMSKSFND